MLARESGENQPVVEGVNKSIALRLFTVNGVPSYLAIALENHLS